MFVQHSIPHYIIPQNSVCETSINLSNETLFWECDLKLLEPLETYRLYIDW